MERDFCSFLKKREQELSLLLLEKKKSSETILLRFRTRFKRVLAFQFSMMQGKSRQRKNIGLFYPENGVVVFELLAQI